MRRALISVLATLAAFAPAAHATTRLADDAVLRALAVGEGRALAVVDSGQRRNPWLLLRSGGSSSREVGTFGAPDSEFPDVTAGHVGWAVPITGGVRLETATLANLEAVHAVGFATGPGLLAAGAVAYPDVEGDLELSSLPGRGEETTARKLTDSAPEARHLALDAATVEGRTLVLDLVQRRGSTQLRVLGPRAPEGAVMSLSRVRHVPATLAVSQELVAVAWLVSGRAHLATARPGGTWRRRRLPGTGAGIGAPAVGIAEGEPLVAYSQRAAGRGGREIFTWRNGSTERLTSAAGDDRDPHLAVGDDGTAFVGWTRRGDGERAAFLTRID